MRLDEFNRREVAEVWAALEKCCGSPLWADRMVSSRPFASEQELFERADEVWWSLERNEWLEAFAQHPKIGERRADAWSAEEQSGMSKAAHETAAAMGRLNREYEEKFDWIFIVCATGKSGDEMLALLEQRLRNDPSDELLIAAGEQAKITRLRLQKLLTK